MPHSMIDSLSFFFGFEMNFIRISVESDKYLYPFKKKWKGLKQASIHLHMMSTNYILNISDYEIYY